MVTSRIHAKIILKYYWWKSIEEKVLRLYKKRDIALFQNACKYDAFKNRNDFVNAPENREFGFKNSPEISTAKAIAFWKLKLKQLLVSELSINKGNS